MVYYCYTPLISDETPVALPRGLNPTVSSKIRNFIDNFRLLTVLFSEECLTLCIKNSRIRYECDTVRDTRQDTQSLYKHLLCLCQGRYPPNIRSSFFSYLPVLLKATTT